MRLVDYCNHGLDYLRYLWNIPGYMSYASMYHYWLVVWKMNFMNFHILGMSSSQLTFIFFRGVETTNQINQFIIHPHVCLFIFVMWNPSWWDPSLVADTLHVPIFGRSSPRWQACGRANQPLIISTWLCLKIGYPIPSIIRLNLNHHLLFPLEILVKSD